jgi:hypothetical protein
MMRVKHAEYSIVIQASNERGLCQYGVDQPFACKNDGSFAIKIYDDRDQILTQYSNLCSAHLVMVVLDQVLGY